VRLPGVIPWFDVFDDRVHSDGHECAEHHTKEGEEEEDTRVEEVGESGWVRNVLKLPKSAKVSISESDAYHCRPEREAVPHSPSRCRPAIVFTIAMIETTARTRTKVLRTNIALVLHPSLARRSGSRPRRASAFDFLSHY
jgi:hypothetical protein